MRFLCGGTHKHDTFQRHTQTEEKMIKKNENKKGGNSKKEQKIERTDEGTEKRKKED